jgi:F-type H+-transporting ATPase subunit a
MMRWFTSFFTAVLLCGLPLSAMAAAAPAAPGEAAPEKPHTQHPASEQHGLPLYAPAVKDFGQFKITSSMIVTWVVALGLILFAQLATRNLKAVPEGLQNFWEWLVESLYDFLEGIIGRDLVKHTFWFFATIFILILSCNWFGLLPGIGSVGWGTPDEHGHLHHITRPLLRGANADLNMTLAMSMIFFICWIYWALKANGPKGFVLHIFGPKGNATGFMKFFLIAIFAVVGVLETVSILFRPVSLSFRLFGNIFAGENVLETMLNMNQYAGWLIALPFYGMELLVGLVQALVFMLLTAVFTLLICMHDEAH